MSNELAFNDLEHVYDELAEAIDRVGEKHTVVFLTKLALLLGNQLGSREIISQSIEKASRDLADEPAPQSAGHAGA